MDGVLCISSKTPITHMERRHTMSMSKKDYELLAQSIAETTVICETEVEGLPQGAVMGLAVATVENLCKHLKNDNPSFRTNSFRARFHDNVATLRQERAAKVAGR